MGGNRSYKDFAALPLFYLMAVPEVRNLRCVAPITFVAEKMRLKSKVQRTGILLSCSLFNILYSSFRILSFTFYCLLFTSHLSPLSSHLSPLISHLSSLTSHLSPLISHLSSLTSHLFPLISFLSSLTSHLFPLSLGRCPQDREASSSFLIRRCQELRTLTSLLTLLHA
jgi:hypothetical protein